MAYSVFDSFPQGVDRTRPIYASQPGTLWSALNGHLTRGGDFETRKGFPVVYALPASTFGMLQAGGLLYVFGSVIPGLITVPTGVTYQQLAHPNGSAAMVEVVAAVAFDGKPYVVARFDDGNVYHYYGGTIVGGWINGVAQNYNNSAATMAQHLVSVINASTTQYTAAYVSGGTFTIEHNTENVAFTIAVNAENGSGPDNTQAMAVTQLAAPGVGVKQKEQITISGVIEVGDRFGVRVGAATYFGGWFNPAYPVASVVYVFGRKVYAGSGSLLHYTGVDKATGWNREMDAGAGFVNISTHDSGAEEITALARYLNYLAVFTPRATQIWVVGSDDSINEPIQTMPNTGCLAQRAAIQFGDFDTFYVGYSGIRSIRSRSEVNLAGVNDVGTPIDALVVEQLASMTADEIRKICSVVEPIDGRLWIAIKDRIYVFSYFPSKKVSGWTWYEPGFTAEWMTVLNNRVYVREGNNIRIYGGLSGTEYEADMEVDCLVPFFSVNKPGHAKSVRGFDIAADGEWQVKILVNPRDTNEYVDIGTVEGPTFTLEDIAAAARTTHFAIRLQRSTGGRSSVSATVVHYIMGESEA